MSDLIEQAIKQFEDLEFSPPDGTDLIVTGKHVAEMKLDGPPSYTLILERADGSRAMLVPPDLTSASEEDQYAMVAHLRTTVLPALGVVRIADVLVNQRCKLNGVDICAVLVEDATGNRGSSAIVEGSKLDWTDDNRVQGTKESSLFPVSH